MITLNSLKASYVISKEVKEEKRKANIKKVRRNVLIIALPLICAISFMIYDMLINKGINI